MKLLTIADRQPKQSDGLKHSRFAVIRNTYPELKTTTIKTWHQWVPESVGSWNSTGPPTHHIRDAERDMEVMFVALDRPEDVRKLLSMEAARSSAAVFALITLSVVFSPSMDDLSPESAEPSALQVAIDRAGGQTQLARRLGLRQSHISNWKNRGKRVPAERVLDIERVTGVSRHDLRPDLYPRETSAA